MKEPTKLVVFDLDGTLNRTECYAVPAMLEALQNFGIHSFTSRDIEKTFGAKDEDTNKLFFGERADELGQLYWKQVDHYCKTKYADSYRSYSGVKRLLKSLKEQGCITAICSNADLDYIELVSKKLEIAGFIDHNQAIQENMTKNDTLKMLLDRVSPQKAVMVGDRYFDMMAAHSNRIPFIACNYGFSDYEELKGADYRVDSPIEILEIVGRVFGEV